MITPADFEDRLDRWGGALERWPPDARCDAEALLAASAAARRLHADTLEVEAALALPKFAAPAADRVTATATRHAQERPGSPRLRRAGWGAAVAAALVLGILVGHADPGQVREDGADRLLASALEPGTGNADVD